jgi:adenylate cyclase
MDFTVLGDHVNLAARLCSAAKPRQTLASSAAVRIPILAW